MQKKKKKADSGLKMNPYMWTNQQPQMYIPFDPNRQPSVSGAYPQGMQPLPNNIQGQSAVQPQYYPDFNQPSLVAPPASPSNKANINMGMASQYAGMAGNIVGGIIGALPNLVNLIPNEQQERAERLPKAVPSPIGNQYNTQMLFDGGGTIDSPFITEENGVRKKSWKQGNIEVSQEMPSWYKETRNVQPLPPIDFPSQNVGTISPPPDINIPTSPYVTYNKQTIPNFYKTDNGQYKDKNYYQPMFHGSWSQQGINQFLETLPSGSYYPTDFAIHNQKGNYINYSQSSFANGGVLSAGQEADLTQEQIDYLRSQGYDISIL